MNSVFKEVTFLVERWKHFQVITAGGVRAKANENKK